MRAINSIKIMSNAIKKCNWSSSPSTGEVCSVLSIHQVQLDYQLVKKTFSSTSMPLVASNWVLFVHLFVNTKVISEAADLLDFKEISWLVSWCLINHERYEPNQRLSLRFMAVSGLVIWCRRCFCRERCLMSWEKGFPLGHKWFALTFYSEAPPLMQLTLYYMHPSLPYFCLFCSTPQ